MSFEGTPLYLNAAYEKYQRGPVGKIFFFGDSITVGAWDAGGGWANRIIGDIMSETIKARFKPEEFYCLPYNLGISGDTVPALLERLEREIAPRMDDQNKAEVIQLVYAIGTNDSQYLIKENRSRFSDDEFRENLEKLIKLSLKISPYISFIGLLPVDEDIVNTTALGQDRAYHNQSIARFENIIAQTCHACRIAFKPMFNAWHSTTLYGENFIDGLHPNSKGHALLAQQLREFVFSSEVYALHRG